MSHDSKCIEGLSHYLGDKQDFAVSSEDPSSGISSCDSRLFLLY